MPGYWKRPIGRVYSYNLDLGENYYSPMKDYISVSDRRARGDSPGPLTHSERIARRWIQGDKDREYRSHRARTEARDMGERSTFLSSSSSPFRGASELRHINTAASEDLEALQRANTVLTSHRSRMLSSADHSYHRVFESTRRCEDDIYKKMADIRMSPWRGQELEQEFKLAQESRARLSGLERELDDVTRSAMRYRPIYHKTARQLAEEAMAEDQRSTASVHRRTTTTSTASSRGYY